MLIQAFESEYALGINKLIVNVLGYQSSSEDQNIERLKRI